MNQKTNITRRNFLAGCGSAAAVGLIRPYLSLAQDNSNTDSDELTFFVAADTHYGRYQAKNNSANNKKIIENMNSAPGYIKYPDFVGGGFVKEPKGLIIAGDLTDNAINEEFFGHDKFDGFDDDYKMDGSGKIKYPVYEGYGNHDYELNGYGHAARDAVKERNKTRKGLTALSDNGYHYSWDWGNVHFVNLNLFPGRIDKKLWEGKISQPMDSLDFLIKDLKENVAQSKRPVVLYHHYGMDESTLWQWAAKDRNDYHETIKNHNIIGIFHGHIHQDMAYTWKGISVYSVNPAMYGGWAIVRIKNNQMFVGLRRWNEWSVIAKKTIKI